MKISLIHPSRGRAAKAFQTYQEWLSLASGEHKIQHVLSLDKDDSQLEDYKRLFKGSTVIVYPNTCVVEATNHAAKNATGEILIYTSDDFEAPQNWDKLVVDKFKDNLHSPMLLKVHDGLQKFDAQVLTIPIVNRALYERLGYFFHPEYKSMWTDCDLHHVCANNHWISGAPELLFQHLHYSNGKSPKDETYTRSDKNWNQGLEVYNRRKKLGFPI